MGEIIKTTTIEDWSLSFWSGDEEPRVQDLDLAARLGYSRPRAIRELIERMIERGQLTQVRRTARRTSEGGAPGTEFYLTEAQALKVAAKSETEPADKLLDEIIRVFLLAKRGELPGQNPKTLEDLRPAAMLGLSRAAEKGHRWAIQMVLGKEAMKAALPSTPNMAEATDAAALVTRFLDERCDRSNPNVRTKSRPLYIIFSQFVTEQGRIVPGVKTFSQTLRALGIRNVKSNGMCWIGIQPKP